MNLPRYLQDRLNSPRRPEGQRHQDILELSLMLVAEGIDDETNFRLLRSRYPDSDKSDKELRNAISGAKSRNPQPANGQDSIVIPTRISYYRPERQLSQKVFRLSDGVREPLPKVKMSTVDFLNLAFRPAEKICLNWQTLKHHGVVRTLEEWSHDFHVDVNFESGCWFRINPVKDESGTDESVSAFRHLLIEFDHRTLEEQWAIYTESDLPITAVIYSGSRSMHALVRVDARDAKEFKERQERVYGYLKDYLDDSGNKNPSRYSRLPGVYRNGKEQKLIAVNIGAKSYQDWIDGIDLPRSITVSALLGYDRSVDPNSIIGDRWINRGASMVIQGASGIGKSSLVMQMSICFCLGKSFFGLAPNKPLKICILQAENSDSDLAEPLQDMLGVMDHSPVEIDRLKENLLFFTETGRTGSAFIDLFKRLTLKYKPDIMICDPLLSFVGADVNSQAIMSSFLRDGINPVLKETGVVCCFIHHLGKGGMNAITDTERNYAGLGSVELVNWARAVVNLSESRDSHGCYDLRFTKRGKRAGILDSHGKSTTKLSLRHSDNGILWEKVEVKPLVNLEVVI